MKQIKVYRLNIVDEATLVGAFNAEDENAEDYAKMLRLSLIHI